MHAAAARQSPAQIARASGSNFLVSFLFLSPGRRRALLAVYAFCRVVDDAVDLAAKDPGTARERLAYWEEELDLAFAGSPRTPLGYALSRAAERFELESEPLHELCAGMRTDLEPRSFASFDALGPYMSKVASAVGIACLPIFGADRERAPRIMGSVYRDLLERVAALGPLVLTRPRVRVPTLRKLWLAVFGV